jgi:hypothetical protein
MNQHVKRVKRDEGIHGALIRAVQSLRAGEVVFYLDGDIVQEPTKYTIQLDARRHVLTRNGMWMYMNHACEPNVRIDVDNRQMIAIRDIPAGAEPMFNYNTTEWDMASPFTCGCGTRGCVGTVRGFRHLNQVQRQAIRPWLSPLILSRFDLHDR